MSIVFEVPVNDSVRLYVEEKEGNHYELITFDVDRNEELSSKRFENLDDAIKYCKFSKSFVREYFD